MSGFTVRNRLFLFGVEASAGVEEALVPGTHAIKIEDPLPTSNFENVERNEASGTLDTSDSAVGGGGFGLTGKVYMKGPGIGAGGTAPEYGALLRVAGLAEVLEAADIIGTAQGGTINTMQLAAADVTTDGDFVGIPIEVTTSGGGPAVGETRVILASVASSDTVTTYPDWSLAPTATTEYVIRASATYAPASASLVNGTGFLYDRSSVAGQDPLLRKFVGSAANLVFNMPTRGAPNFDVTLTGLLPSIPANVSDPGAGTFDAVTPPVLRNGDVWIGPTATALAPKFDNWSVDMGNEIAQADDPSALYGFDIACITSRGITGSVNPNLEDLATYNAFQAFINETKEPFWGMWGTKGGNRVSILLNPIKYTGYATGDNDGFNTEELEFESKAPDAGIYICHD